LEIGARLDDEEVEFAGSKLFLGAFDSASEG